MRRLKLENINYNQMDEDRDVLPHEIDYLLKIIENGVASQKSDVEICISNHTKKTIIYNSQEQKIYLNLGLWFMIMKMHYKHNYPNNTHGATGEINRHILTHLLIFFKNILNWEADKILTTT